MATTVGDLIKKSMQLIGVLSPGETPQNAEMQDALSTLNGMIGSWNTENLLVTAFTTEEFPLTAGKQVYTLGPVGDFNTTRPQSIESAQLHLTGSNDYYVPITILNVDQWNAISVKTTTSSIPTQIYIQPTYPLANVFVWPVPNGVSSLVLTSTKPISDFATSSTTLDMAPGYFDALRFGLALRLAPEYQKQVDPIVVALANEAKENIKRLNIKPIFMQSDAPSGTISGSVRFNILTGS